MIAWKPLGEFTLVEDSTIFEILQKTPKENISTKARNGNYSVRSLQKDWDDPGDTVKMKEDIKLGNGVTSAWNYKSEENALQEKTYFLEQQNSGLNMKNQKSPKSNEHKYEEEIMEII